VLQIYIYIIYIFNDCGTFPPQNFLFASKNNGLKGQCRRNLKSHSFVHWRVWFTIVPFKHSSDPLSYMYSISRTIWSLELHVLNIQNYLIHWVTCTQYPELSDPLSYMYSISRTIWSLELHVLNIQNYLSSIIRQMFQLYSFIQL